MPRYCVTLAQDGVSYQLDYSRVYWNSRLSNEHLSLARHVSEALRPDDLVLDGTGGIGPHAILLAKRFGFTNVICNDLNPHAYEYMQQNVRANKVERAVTCMNDDVVAVLCRLLPENRVRAVIFSLPELSTELLKVMRGCSGVHCFLECFTRVPRELSYLDLLLQCSESLFGADQTGVVGSPDDTAADRIRKLESSRDAISSLRDRYDLFEVKEVRTVSTNKYMYRVALRVRSAATTDSSRPAQRVVKQ